MKILQIDTSISPSDSVSRLLTAAIVKRIKGQDASVTITYRDLITDPIPYMNLRTLPSAHPVSIASDLLPEEDRWARGKTEVELDEFLCADMVILGVPMYNFGIAAQLKSWLDAIVIPGKTFAYTSDGPVGLAGAKRIILAISRGSFYGAIGFPFAMEHAESYVRSVLSFIGIAKPDVVRAEGVALDRVGAIERGRTAIEALAP